MYPNSTFSKLTSFGDCLNLSFLNYLLKSHVLGFSQLSPLHSSGQELPWPFLPPDHPSYTGGEYIYIPNKNYLTYKKNPNGSEIAIYKVCK